jgi:hypothetical protein
MAKTRYRTTITGLMAVVLCVGLGLAALRNADEYWAAGTYNLAALVLSLAAVCAINGRRRVRTAASGFVVFALVYLLFASLRGRDVNSFGFGPQRRPALALEQGFVFLQPYLKPISSGDMSGFICYDQVAQSLAMMIFGALGAVAGRMVAARRPDDED